MKSSFMFFSVFLLVASSAWAAPRWRTVSYVVDYDDYYTNALKRECEAAEQFASARLSQAEESLGISAGSLKLRAGITSVPNGPGYPYPGGTPMPGEPQRWHYECVLQFHSEADSVKLRVDVTKMKTHIPRDEHATACKPELDQLGAQKSTLFTQYEMGQTLFQGRTCQVGYVEAIKK